MLELKTEWKGNSLFALVERYESSIREIEFWLSMGTFESFIVLRYKKDPKDMESEVIETRVEFTKENFTLAESTFHNMIIAKK